MASFNVKVGGSWSPVSGLWVHTGNMWRSVSKAYRNVAGTWRLVYDTSTAPPPTPGPGMLAVSISPSSFNRLYSSAAAGGSFSQAFTPMVTGAVGTVTGTWTQTDTTGHDATSSISGQVLTLSGFWAKNANRPYNGTWRYDAVDSGSSSTGFATFDISVEVDNGH